MNRRKILFATDYSDISLHAFEHACTLAKDLDAVLLIVHVSEHELYPVGEACHEEQMPNPEEMERLEEVIPERSEVDYEHRLLYAQPTSANVRPADEIINLADKEDVYTIVVGTHGRSGLGRALVGSTAEAIVRHAGCPVVTVRLAE